MKIIKIDGLEFHNWEPLLQDRIFQRFPNLIELETTYTIINDLETIQLFLY
jgi:hypothetical protein